MRTNKRVGALIRRNEKILLIHRFKNGNEYWVLPGGGVEDEETLEEALVREIREETSLSVMNHRLLGDRIGDEERHHFFFEIETEDKEPILGGPEKENMSDDNIYILEWVSVEFARSIDSLFPYEIREYF